VRFSKCSKVKVVFGIDARWNVDVELKCLEEIPFQLVATNTCTYMWATAAVTVVPVVTVAAAETNFHTDE